MPGLDLPEAVTKMNLLKFALFIFFFLLTLTVAAADKSQSVVIGLSAEFGVKNSIAAQSIEKGILLAIDEINASGGVLNGRKLKLAARDDRGLPARGVDNFDEFAATPDVVAVFSGRFSPVTIELASMANRNKLLLLCPWSAADVITQHAYPNYVFRLSTTDTWAMDKILDYAHGRGLKRLALFIPNTAWGRSSEAALLNYEKRVRDTRHMSYKYNWGETDFRQKIREALDAGSQAIILVSNEAEGVVIIQQIAELSVDKRIPVISHWGITGGDFAKMAGDALNSVDLAVLQTFTFNDMQRSKVKRVAQGFERLFGENIQQLRAQAGFAHAYDLTHMLALAINKAGSTDREAVRAAMEQLGSYNGLVREYRQPFTKIDHEALDRSQLFIGRFDQYGNVRKINKN
jgi:branched-chain amino acid transport system substrate-binding protein